MFTDIVKIALNNEASPISPVQRLSQARVFLRPQAFTSANRYANVSAMVSKPSELASDDRFAMTWMQLEALAKSKDWKNLSPELRLRLAEEDTKSKRMKIPIDFEDLGFRILRISAEFNPTGSWEARLSDLESHAVRLLGDRHPALKYVQRCAERMQALMAINTSAAWAELASVLRIELEKPDWALEAAEISLQKDSENVAALTTKVASHGDMANFDLANQDYERARLLEPKNRYLAAAIAKVHLRERKFDDALDEAMAAFKSEPHAATARLVANIYKEAGLENIAHRWYTEAEYIEKSEDDQITQAHIAGLLELARSAASNPEHSDDKSE
ncbi:hypothetical protein OAR17_02170 [Pontimonas sp.]|nr:hypothetical protein [Pontimonas sp.]